MMHQRAYTFFFFSVKTDEPRFLENLLGRVWKIDCKRERAKKIVKLVKRFKDTPITLKSVPFIWSSVVLVVCIPFQCS